MLFLFSKVKVRLLYYEKPRIIISFLCFDLILFDFKKKQKNDRTFTLKNFKNFFSLINDTAAKTEIQINRLYLPDISDIQFLNGLTTSLLSVLIVYISSKAVKIKTKEHFMQRANFDIFEIDLTLSGRILPIGIIMLKSYFINNR